MLDAGDRETQGLAPGVIEEIAERNADQCAPFILVEGGYSRVRLVLQGISGFCRHACLRVARSLSLR
ncbi:hypothetical protein D3C80_1791470 [compost metagenome]